MLVTARKTNGDEVHFVTTCCIAPPVEVEYYRHGGILHKVLRDLVKSRRGRALSRSQTALS